MRKIVSREIRTLEELSDPKKKIAGELQWFYKLQMPKLLEVWERIVPQEEDPDEKHELKEVLRKIMQHDPYAGMLGVMPKGVQKLYEKYFFHFDDTSYANAEEKTKKVRKLAAEQIVKIRKQCIRTSCAIWRVWKKMQDEYRAQQKQILHEKNKKMNEIMKTMKRINRSNRSVMKKSVQTVKEKISRRVARSAGSIRRWKMNYKTIRIPKNKRAPCKRKNRF